jgi:hypothetical protein
MCTTGPERTRDDFCEFSINANGTETHGVLSLAAVLLVIILLKRIEMVFVKLSTLSVRSSSLSNMMAVQHVMQLLQAAVVVDLAIRSPDLTPLYNFMGDSTGSCVHQKIRGNVFLKNVQASSRSNWTTPALQ